MKIKKFALEFIVQLARNALPHEFVGMLRAENKIITEVLLIPGSEFGTHYSRIFLNMVPIDPSIVGSVHSHPGAPNPSKADFHFFSKFGRVHLIIGLGGAVRAFNSQGSPIDLEIVK